MGILCTTAPLVCSQKTSTPDSIEYSISTHLLDEVVVDIDKVHQSRY